MSFGLKNADAFYQKVMDKAFEKQIGRNVEVYVDDIFVKSKKEDDLIKDTGTAEVFEQLRRYRLSLNPDKCVFDVQEGKFLRFMVSE